MNARAAQNNVAADARKRMRASRGKTRWHLAYAPGREQAVCDKLRKIAPPELLDDAFIMRKERWRKFHGEWKCSTVPVYEDYFFVATKDAAALDKELARLSFPFQIARTDGQRYAPLSSQVQAWYERMADGIHVIRSSIGVIVDGELDVQQGPLVGQEANVVKVVRPKRFCFVAVHGDSDGDGFRACVPLVIPFQN